MSYNRCGYVKSAASIENIQYWDGDDQAVLYTIISLARSRGLLTDDYGWADSNYDYFTYIDRFLWGHQNCNC